MNKYREIRKVRGSDLRNLCIKNNWYTKGDCEDYERLLGELSTAKGNITTADIIEIAEDIANHSELEEGWDIESIAFEVGKLAFSFFSKVNERYLVKTVSAGGVKKTLLSFDTKKEADDFCERLGWKWADAESGFVWALEIEKEV